MLVRVVICSLRQYHQRCMGRPACRNQGFRVGVGSVHSIVLLRVYRRCWASCTSHIDLIRRLPSSDARWSFSSPRSLDSAPLNGLSQAGYYFAIGPGFLRPRSDTPEANVRPVAPDGPVGIPDVRWGLRRDLRSISRRKRAWTRRHTTRMHRLSSQFSAMSPDERITPSHPWLRATSGELAAGMGRSVSRQSDPLPAQTLAHCDAALPIQCVETWAKASCNSRADVRGRKRASDR
ncbi:uncharacterized protein SCHCODRAFT_02074004 [Schizophyllum commune H4-8]|uniref:uncharacterized protein n=1 Tax=Schizophyllum commune (strain H4-8 / FGSC 9210) TaxID=578458 RepID=UPI00215E006A|nr:uncharacterized protein SCHCODRAFT_02074004 [Schizophyllum commune H4-8]KAI5887889.1 hypothetical protein SCHCODRAFT_02074004 [Schizophyllum commune H4-8]